jgi:ribosomal-protein-alanine N-acetyltransferase
MFLKPCRSAVLRSCWLRRRLRVRRSWRPFPVRDYWHIVANVDSAEVHPLTVYPFAIRGRRVNLREVDGRDTAAAMRWARDPEFFRFLLVPPPATEHEERGFLERIAAEARQRPRFQYHVGIEDGGSGELVGMVRLGVVSVDDREGDLGYGLRRDARGRGLATEAVSMMLVFGFAELGLHRIFATHHPDNSASERLLARVGMTREGVLREHRIVAGAWRDSVLSAILDHELLDVRRPPVVGA